MKKTLLIITTIFYRRTKSLSVFTGLIILSQSVIAQNTKTWIGASGGTWSTPGNWSPAGIPAGTDTVIFNSNNPCDMDVSPVIASSRAIGLGGNIISSGGLRSLTINNGGAASPVLYVAAGAFLSMGNGGFGINFSTYGASGPNNAQVDGTIFLAFSSAWSVNNAGITNITNVDISGGIYLVSVHTGALFNNSTTGTVRFLSGSTLTWARNGGVVPVADYQNGSTINVTGVTSTMPSFSSGANYNGLLIWNNNSQTISGASAVLLPASNAAMDSIRVMNTGTGSLQMFGDPSNYTIGHLEVQGGVVELASPASLISTGTINTDLIVSGGTLYCNATFSGDVVAAYPVTITVNGNLTQTGGTINLTNRPVFTSPGGAAFLKVKGNVTQTAGLFTATSNFGGQNQLSLAGTATQNVQMNNLTGIFSFSVLNSTNGASLQSNLVLPYQLTLSSGYIKLNNFNLSVAAGNIIAVSNGKVVTNGTGSLLVTGLTASTSQDFPVAPTAAAYNPVTLVPSASAVSPNTYAVRVETGLLSYPIFSPANAVDRTWVIRATTTPNAPVNVVFSYYGGDGGASFNYAGTVDHGVYTTAWNINQTGLTPSGTNPYQVSTSVTSFVGGVDLPMVLGNTGSILNTPRSIDLSVQKQASKAILNWTYSNAGPIREVVVEHSVNGRSFNRLATMASLITTYTDDNLLQGINYYRIKITDINGKITYSAIAAIINATDGFDIVALLPNIVHADMQVSVAAAQKTKLNLVITDVAGRPVSKLQFTASAGSNMFDVNVSKLSSGMYYITATAATGETKTLGFVKQ